MTLELFNDSESSVDGYLLVHKNEYQRFGKIYFFTLQGRRYNISAGKLERKISYGSPGRK
jgi:hypothetical protein